MHGKRSRDRDAGWETAVIEQQDEATEGTAFAVFRFDPTEWEVRFTVERNCEDCSTARVQIRPARFFGEVPTEAPKRKGKEAVQVRSKRR